MVKTRAILGNTLVVAGLLCIATAAAAETQLSWTGCGITKLAFMAELAKAYEAKTGIAVKLSGGGATKGIRAVAAGTADIGGTCRHWLKGVGGSINPEEQGAELVQVAWDALAVVTHPSNPVDSISTVNLKKVYDGKITNWSQLGGPDKRIALVVREGKTSGVGYMFRELVFDNPAYEFKALALKEKSTGPLEKRVEKTPGALAMDGISSARKREVKVLSIDGVAPTKDEIASGKYPLFRPLYLTVAKNGASPEAKRFIEFARSPEGQAIIAAQGTVNLKEGAPLKALWQAKKATLGLVAGTP